MNRDDKHDLCKCHQLRRARRQYQGVPSSCRAAVAAAGDAATSMMVHGAGWHGCAGGCVAACCLLHYSCSVVLPVLYRHWVALSQVFANCLRHLRMVRICCMLVWTLTQAVAVGTNSLCCWHLSPRSTWLTLCCITGCIAFYAAYATASCRYTCCCRSAAHSSTSAMMLDWCCLSPQTV